MLVKNLIQPESSTLNSHALRLPEDGSLFDLTKTIVDFIKWYTPPHLSLAIIRNIQYYRDLGGLVSVLA